MRNFITRVTITGADDTVKVDDLLKISGEYVVEWGILFGSNAHVSRFPSKDWTNELLSKVSLSGQKTLLSAHLCGKYIKEVLCGSWHYFFNKYPYAVTAFDRIQLNFHGERHAYDQFHFLEGLSDQNLSDKQIIFQLDNINDKLLTLSQDLPFVDCVGLFDLSHGAGVLPSEWPKSTKYVGYAGGLSPANIEENIKKISKVAKGNIWVDFETHARNDNDEFDLNKCVDFLEKCKPYMVKMENLCK